MPGSNAGSWRGWRHVTKLDPDRPVSDAALERLAASGTDALVLGGTGGLTEEKVLNLLGRVRPLGLPVAIEVASPACLLPGADWYLVPVVLNAGDPWWLAGAHVDALRRLLALGVDFDWPRVLSEGYLVQNPASAVARLTGARPAATSREAESYALLAERVYHLPIFYVEYSGSFGDPELVRAAGRQLAGARLFYGGGVDSEERAAAVAAVAHTVVVGNALYSHGPEGVAATVRGVRRVAAPARGGTD